MTDHQDKKTLTPKLRFPEFTDGTGWDAINGDELFDLVDRRPALKGLPILAITQEHGAVPRDHIDYHVSVSDTSIASYKEVQPADFIISLRSFQGGIEYSRFHGICSPAYLILKRKGDGDDNFFRHLFKSDRFIQQLTRNIEGLRDGKMISYKQFSDERLPTPSPAEQRKIAACLTSLDELLAAQGRKLEALRALKKGLMQQLFPLPGESRPHLRFPEFRDAGGWVNEQLSSCLDAVIDYRGKAPPKAESGVPLITARNVRFGWLDMTADEYIPEDEYEKWMCKGVPQAGDILFTTEAPLGNVARFPDVGRFALGQRLLTLRADPAKCFHGFLLQSLLGPRMQEEIHLRSTGSTAKGIKSSVFVTIRFCHPGVAEQQRIAACLGSLDAVIAAASRKLDGLRAHKKGLLQQFFPSEGV
jgi:type I restriction enzyme, S subunit